MCSEKQFTKDKSSFFKVRHQSSNILVLFCFDTGPRKEAGLQMIIPGEKKVLGEGPNRNGQSAVEDKSLVDVVYALRDEVQELKQDTKKMKRSLEEEQRARKDLEKVVRRVLKSMNDPTWDETNL